MSEKQFNIDNAFSVWWFIFWRAFLLVFFLNALFFVIGAHQPIFDYVILMAGIVAQVYFLKISVNRNYGGPNGSFRLSAREVERPVGPQPR